MSAEFRPTREGTVKMALGEGEVAFLRHLASLLDEIGSEPGDPAAERLNVTPYLDDADASDEYRRLMLPELEQSRAADRSAFEELLSAAPGGVEMSRGEAEAMIRVLVEARLALASRMKVEVEADYQDLDGENAAALDYLAHLQLALIRALDP